MVVDKTMEFLQHTADVLGISLEEAITRLYKRDAILNTPLLPANRLSTAEKYLQTGDLNPFLVRNLLDKQPILQEEIKALSYTITDEISFAFKLDMPEHIVTTNPEYNVSMQVKTVGSTSHFSSEIALPENAGLEVVNIISHELGHVYQNHHSKLTQRLTFLQRKTEKLSTAIKESRQLVEGWAEYLSLSYAKERDSQLGIDVYETMFRESCGMREILGKANGIDYSRYHEGLRLFEKISQKEGFDGAKNAALELLTDKELQTYANK